MKVLHTGPHRNGRYIHKKETHILSAAAAALAFIVVYVYASDPKIYYAIVAGAVTACVIYFANYLQFHRGRHS